MPISFSTAEVLQIQSGDVDDTLLAKINGAEEYEKSAGLRAKVKAACTTNATAFIAANLAALSIPDGVKEITLTFDFSDETKSFGVRKSGVNVAMGNDVLATPSVAMQSLLIKAFDQKDGDTKEIITDFIRKAIGGQKIVNHVLATADFNKSTKPKLDELYTVKNAVPLSAGIDEVPKGDNCKVVLKYQKLAADKPAEWIPIVSCGKTASSGEGGSRRKRTAAPDGYKTWAEFCEKDQSPETVAAVQWAIKRYGANWTKNISQTGLLRKFKHPAIIEADNENPARA